MGELNNKIREIRDLAKNFSEGKTLDEIGNSFDASEYVKARPVWAALRSFAARAEQFDNEDLDNVVDEAPHQARNRIIEQFVKVRSAVETTVDYIRVAKGNAAPPRKQHFQEQEAAINTAENILYEVMMPYVALTRNLPSTITQGLRDEIAKASETLSNLKSEVEAASKEKQQVAAAVLTHDNVEEINFSINRHEGAASKWLWTFVALSVASAGVVGYLNFFEQPLPQAPSPVEVAAHFIGKLLLITFFFGLCVLASRIYQTHVHNVIVNRQRKIASVSFLQMLKALESSDKETQTELVKQAAQSIFAHTSTGFLNKSSNELMPLTSVLAEIIKRK